MQDPLSGFRYGAKNTADVSVFIPAGSERKGKVHFLGISGSLEDQLLIFCPRGNASLENASQHRTKHVPNIGPYDLERLSKRPWMFISQDWCVGVVVQGEEFRTPEEDDGKAGIQTDAHRR